MDKEAYRTPLLSVHWEETETGYVVLIEGEHAVEITKELNDDNGVVFLSPAFRSAKTNENLKDVLRLALVNSVNSAFNEEWRKRYQPEKKSKLDLERENTELKRKIAEMDEFFGEKIHSSQKLA